MVPALSALGLRSIGFLPAFIGLTLYSVLPVLRNTVTGLAGLDPALKEAARGVGMTSRQQLWRVELPLALPVILAGLRTSTVWTVGMATLSTPVGAPSLGNYIFAGLQTRNLTAVLVGCVAAARARPAARRVGARTWRGRARAQAVFARCDPRRVRPALRARDDRVRGVRHPHRSRLASSSARRRSPSSTSSARFWRRRSRAPRAVRWTWRRRWVRPSRSMRFVPATSTPTWTTRERSGRPSCVAMRRPSIAERCLRRSAAT